MLQTVLPTKLFQQYEFQSMKSPRYTPTPSPNHSSSFNSSNALQKTPNITPFGKQERAPTEPSCPTLQEEGQETWPEIDAIVGKIRTLESTLKNQRKTTALLTQKIRQLEGNLATIEEERNRAAEQDGRRAAQASEWQQKYDDMQERMRELEQMISQKEAQLAQRQQLIENIQFGQLQKNSQYEARIRKLNTDAKDLTDRLRKANMQAEKQRKSNQQLRNSMSSQLQQLQSQRDTYLLDEIQRLKTLINSSKEEREALLYEQIDTLNRTNYLHEQEIRKKDIELALAERKKHQAVADIIEKKDQEVKVQKTLSKALNEKIAKLQEEMKSAKTQQDLQRGLRRSHQRVKTHGNEQEVSFELSPEKL